MKQGDRYRYREFCPKGIKIHPLKRFISLMAVFFPKSWRFFWLGLPVRRERRLPGETENEVTWIKGGIACRLGAHLDSHGAYIAELTLGAGPFIETRFLQKQKCFPSIRRVEGKVLSLVLEGDLNYYRWLMEALPRMRFVREKGIVAEWLYCRQEQPFHRESMALLGWDPERIIASDRNKFIRAEEMAIPRFVEETEPWIIPWLREQFLPPAEERISDALPKRIYLTRRKASGRRVANEGELLERLEALGFSAVSAEDYDWLGQAALFQNAEIIIGPHGAGLANLIFCSTSVRVIEFIAEAYPFTFYPEISRQLGMEHHLLFCAPSDSSRVACSDLHVCVDSVVRILEKSPLRSGGRSTPPTLLV